VTWLQQEDEVDRRAQISAVDRYGKRWFLKRSLLRRVENSCSVEDAMTLALLGNQLSESISKMRKGKGSEH
jgi:hypothetical protein